MAIALARLQAILDDAADLEEPQRSVQIATALRALIANPQAKRPLWHSTSIAAMDELVARHRPEWSAEQRAALLAKGFVPGLNPDMDPLDLARTVRRHRKRAGGQDKG